MQEIAPGIYVESNYPPYNLALISTDKGPIVVDIPPRPSHAWAWRHQVEEMAGKPRYAVITDASPERQIAAALWDRPIIASEDTLRIIAAYDERGWRDRLHLFAALYRAAPAPYAAYLDLGEVKVASSSPELFLAHRPDNKI